MRKRAMTSTMNAVFSFGKLGTGLVSIRDIIILARLLLFIFLIVPSALAKLNGISPSGYFNAFSKSTVFPFLTDIDKSFARISRLTSTVFLLFPVSFFVTEAKFLNLHFLMGSWTGISP